MGLVLAKNAKRRSPGCDLNLEPAIADFTQAHLAGCSDAKRICVVKLDFSPGRWTGKKAVLHHQRRVHTGGDQVARITSLDRHIPVDDADTRHPAAFISGVLLGVHRNRQGPCEDDCG